MEVSIKPRAVLIRAVALAGVLVGLTLFINLSWFDEALHPEIARLIPPEPVPMEDNAYPLAYGFLAAADTDPREAGLTIVRRLRELYADGERMALDSEEIAAILGQPDPAEIWKDLFPANACNSRTEVDCADRLIAEAARTDPGHARLGLLLERYETVLEAQHFEENQEFDAYTPLPAYDALVSTAKIRLAFSYATGDTNRLLADIRKDVRFWKTMLRDGQSLVAKMVALAGLRHDAMFLSTLLRERELADSELAAIGHVLTPLTEDEKDIGETFLAELRIGLLSAKSLAVLLEGPPAITRLALQENATMNEHYFTSIVPLQLKAALSPYDFYRQGAYEPRSYDVRAMPPPLYNLGGKFVLKWMANEMNMQDYISRVHDLDGRIALVLLQTEIARSPDRDPQDVIRRSVYRNPYTREPMNYDAASGTIRFDCLAPGTDVCAVALEKRGL